MRDFLFWVGLVLALLAVCMLDAGSPLVYPLAGLSGAALWKGTRDV